MTLETYGYGLMTMFAKKIKIDHDLPKEAVAFFFREEIRRERIVKARVHVPTHGKGVC